MSQLSKEESLLLLDIVTNKKFELVYGFDKKVSYQSPDSKTIVKYRYSPIPDSATDPELIRAKDKGVWDLYKDPFYVQNKVTVAKRNDRFKRVPGAIFGITPDKTFYNFELLSSEDSRKKEKKPYTLFNAIRMPSWRCVSTNEGKYYHVYSPLKMIPHENFFDKKYSLKMLEWLVSPDRLSEQKFNESILAPASFLIRSMMKSYRAKPDYIVYMKSSKPLIDYFVKTHLLGDEWLKSAKTVVISKPKPKDLSFLYFLEKSNFPSDSKLSEVLESSTDVIKQKTLSHEDRGLYMNLCYKFLSKEVGREIPLIKNSTILIIDDIITSGSTMSKLLIPLFSKNNNRILPFSIFIR